MLNLLPIDQKKKIILEYRLRAVWVCVSVLLFLFIIALVGILPSYVNEKLKIDAINQQKEVLEKEKNNPKNIAIIKKAEANRALVNYLDKQIKNIGKPSALASISEILNKKTNTIKINSFSFKDQQLIITGVADNRTELNLFYQSLKDDPYFSSASLPLSDIVKSVENNFTIELMVK